KIYDEKTSHKQESDIDLGVELSNKPKLKSNLSDKESVEQSRTIQKIKGLNAQEFLNRINTIKKKANIDSIYVFIDEYSDLNA
ncbi:hypothetical protein, partial [Methylophaga sp. UBA3996]